jgi:transposase
MRRTTSSAVNIRERQCLVGERTRIVNRMKATLARLGVRNFKPTLRKAAERLATVHTPEGMPLPPNISAELQRDMARLGFVVSQIREIEEARQKRLEQETETGSHAMVRLLARVVGIGIETADMLVHEVLSRPMRDRKAVARHAGLTGSPNESGAKRREQGLARAGNASGPPWHDPTRLALPAVSEAERTGAVVPGPHCR